MIPLSFEDYNWNIHSLLTNTEKAESLSYKQSWKFVILVETIKSLNNWYVENNKTVPKEKNDTTNYNLRRAFELAPKSQLNAFVKDPNAHLLYQDLTDAN